MRSPEPGGTAGRPPGPPNPISLLPVCPPETLLSPGLVSSLCPSGGGLRLPRFPRGTSARRWGPLLLGLPAPARRLKRAATVRSYWPWRLAAVNAAASFLQCAGHPGGGLDAAGPPGTQSTVLRAPQPGSPAACYPACTTLLALPPASPQESRTLPCPCLHVDTNHGLFGVHGRWARLGQDPVSSPSAWMMVLKHNMQSNVLVCALEFLLPKSKKTENGSKQSPAPQNVYLDITDVLGWERHVLSPAVKKRLDCKLNSLEACDRNNKRVHLTLWLIPDIGL